MIALIVTSIVFAALVGYVLHQAQAATARAEQRIDALLSAHRDEVKALTDQVVLLKVEPQMAAIQAVPAEATTKSPYVSAFDDDALAEYEQERARLEASTREFVEQYAGAPE